MFYRLSLDITIVIIKTITKENSLANHKSSEKRAKQTIKKRETNKIKKSATRTEIKKLRDLVAKKDETAAKKQLLVVQSKLAKLSKSSAVHKNNTARMTSRLAGLVNTISK